MNKTIKSEKEWKDCLTPEEYKILREKGLLVVPASNNVIRLLPPLNITKKEAQKAIDIINEAVNELK